jgi:predicted ATPase
MALKYIKIKNFKSIVEAEIRFNSKFAVFAGANGSGKSNFFESLEFLRDIIRNGAKEALKFHNGYENVHSHKLRNTNAKKFYIKMEVELAQNHFIYELELKDLDKVPALFETLIKNGTELAKKSVQGNIFLHSTKQELDYSINESILKLVSKDARELLEFLMSIERYQIDPVKAREADDNYASDTLLRDASNISTVLTNLEKEPLIVEEMIETMQMIVPGLESFVTEKEKLNNKSVLLFKENSVKRRFPAGLISDGTIYALAMLTIIYSNQKGIVLIEEPERGLNPKAITELMEFFREKSKNFNIFINTHSESVVRAATADELFIVDKCDGKTILKNVIHEFPEYDYTSMELDKMWMSNLFNGGLPW